MQNISGSIGLTENIGRLLGILFVCRSYCYGYGGCLHKCPRFSRLGWSHHHSHSTSGATCSCTGKGLSIAHAISKHFMNWIQFDVTAFLPGKSGGIPTNAVSHWQMRCVSFRVKSYLTRQPFAWKLHGGFCDGMGENWNFPTCMMSGRESIESIADRSSFKPALQTGVIRRLADMSGVKRPLEKPTIHFPFRHDLHLPCLSPIAY